MLGIGLRMTRGAGGRDAGVGSVGNCLKRSDDGKGSFFKSISFHFGFFSETFHNDGWIVQAADPSSKLTGWPELCPLVASSRHS